MEPDALSSASCFEGGFPDAHTEFFVPFVPPSSLLEPERRGRRIARIKPGVTRQSAAAEVNGLLSQQPDDQRPGVAGAAPPLGFELVGVQDLSPSEAGTPCDCGGPGFPLADRVCQRGEPLLARMAACQREMAVRLALGAGRGRLVRQVVAESLLLARAAAVAGTGLAFGGVRLLRDLGTGLARRDLGPSISLPRLDEVSIDGAVFVFTLAVAILTGLAFGLG